MGLFSSIGKFFKKVWKGIGKGFKKVLGVVGKLLDSKLGKVLMMAVSVFTLGSALIAAQGAYAAASVAGQSFISSFIQGGKVFLKTLVGMGGQEGAASTSGAQGAAEAVASTTPNASAVAAGANPLAAATDVGAGIDAATTAGGALSEAGAAATAAGGAGVAMSPVAQVGGDALTVLGNPAANATVAAGASGQTAAGGWLSKAASAAKDFVKGVGEYAKTDAGQNLIGGALEGYARSDELDRIDARESRAARTFEPGNPARQRLDALDMNVPVPTGLNAQDVGRATGRAAGTNYQQRIPYQQQPAPAGG